MYNYGVCLCLMYVSKFCQRVYIRLSLRASRANCSACWHHSARDEHRASAAHCVREIPIAVNGRGFSRRPLICISIFSSVGE